MPDRVLCVLVTLLSLCTTGCDRRPQDGISVGGKPTGSGSADSTPPTAGDAQVLATSNTISKDPKTAARVERNCKRARECGCPEHDKCVENYQRNGADDFPDSMWSCWDELFDDCARWCDRDENQRCVDASIEEYQQNRTKHAVPRFCTRLRECSCGFDECEAKLSDSPAMADIWNCATELGCDHVCAKMDDPETTLHQTCVVPVKQALEARGRSSPYQYIGRTCRGGTDDCPNESLTVCCDLRNSRFAPSGITGTCQFAALCLMPTR